MGYMLETRGLTKRFGRGDQAQDAVADVSLHIREGEVYGLLGPNGAGKSTTLKMICGMLRPTAGEILFAGHAWRREDLYAIGSLIEEAPLYPNLTARENLRVRTTLLGLPESRVDGLATLMWTVPGGARETGGPYMRDPRHPRHFTDEFKRQIVDLYNAGKPKREIMDEYDLGKSTVERWIKSINATGSPRAADNRTPEQNRILELERENRRLRMEVDVLKQAALIYARK